MKPLRETAAEMAQSIDRRFGIDDVLGLETYLARSLRDVTAEVLADKAVPEFEDPTDALTRYLARRAGDDPAAPALYLYHRQDAVRIIDALTKVGLDIGDLAGFFLPALV